MFTFLRHHRHVSTVVEIMECTTLRQTSWFFIPVPKSCLPMHAYLEMTSGNYSFLPPVRFDTGYQSRRDNLILIPVAMASKLCSTSSYERRNRFGGWSDDVSKRGFLLQSCYSICNHEDERKFGPIFTTRDISSANR